MEWLVVARLRLDKQDSFAYGLAFKKLFDKCKSSCGNFELGSMLIPHLQEVVRVVQLTVLTSRQYCVVLDPFGADGKPRLGGKELRKGPHTFFLHPGNILYIPWYMYLCNVIAIRSSILGSIHKHTP